MTSRPAAVISRALGALHGRHVAPHQMFLQSACVGKGRAAAHLDPVGRCGPLAHEYFGVGGVFRTGQNRRGAPIQRGRGLARTQLRAHTGPRMTGVWRVRSIGMDMSMSVRATPVDMRATRLPVVGRLVRESRALHFGRVVMVVGNMRDMKAGEWVRNSVISGFVRNRAGLRFVDVELMASRQVRACHHVEHIRRVYRVL